MTRYTTRWIIQASVMAMAATGVSAANDNWPHFRGPTMNATVADNPNLPVESRSVGKPGVPDHGYGGG